MSKTLAIKYRPQEFDDVVEQDSIKAILMHQLENNETKNAYLFCGGAGTGKTTCARIFASAINNHQGNPIEMDAASNSGVDDVREIINQAKTKSLDSEYKVFIIDECHSISNTGWQAFLKLIEEPPAKSIFIFCTTDPQKIPKTILSRVQRYDFKRISYEGIRQRLLDILHNELVGNYDVDAVEYIAKIADGGMRDAVTMLDKCLSYSKELTVDNVLKALGIVDYDIMIQLASSLLISKDFKVILELIEHVHMSGKDLKQFIKSFTEFVLDLNKYRTVKDFKYLSIPVVYENDVDSISSQEGCPKLLSTLVKLNANLKWETSPKFIIEATLIGECYE